MSKLQFKTLWRHIGQAIQKQTIQGVPRQTDARSIYRKIEPFDVNAQGAGVYLLHNLCRFGGLACLALLKDFLPPL